ncbi:MAG TPA: dihydrolipoyl dehydrogenase, partial [Sedimenticola sp.]|nr:dihydrolipoyl dehydrogenase [Sedimenticola sp.]
MSNIKEITLPDIGDFESVDIIEVLVKPGDEIEAEDPLITLESDKATMTIPSPHAGRVEEVLVKVGDSISQGGPILKLALAAGEDAETPRESSVAPVSEAVKGGVDRQVEVVVLGGGPGGYT